MGREPVVTIDNDYLKQEIAVYKARRVQNPDRQAITAIEQKYGVHFIEVNMNHGNLTLRGFGGNNLYTTFSVPDFERHETSIRFGCELCDVVMERARLPVVADVSRETDPERRHALQLRRVMPDTAVQLAGRTKKVLEGMF